MFNGIEVFNIKAQNKKDEVSKSYIPGELILITDLNRNTISANIVVMLQKIMKRIL